MLVGVRLAGMLRVILHYGSMLASLLCLLHGPPRRVRLHGRRFPPDDAASRTWALYAPTPAACERAWLRLGGVASTEPQMRRVLDLLRAAGPSIG